MKRLTIFTLIVFVVTSLSSIITHADDPIVIITEPIPVQMPPETKKSCILIPTAENEGFKIFSSVDIFYLAHSYKLFEHEQSGIKSDIKCMAKFRFPPVLTLQTNACSVIDRVVARGELAEAMCATLASALGSDFPRFVLITVKETKLGLELQDLVWQREPPACECPQCPQCPEGEADETEGRIILEPMDRSVIDRIRQLPKP